MADMPFLLRPIGTSRVTLWCLILKMCTEFPEACFVAHMDEGLTTCSCQSSFDLTQEYGAMKVLIFQVYHSCRVTCGCCVVSLQTAAERIWCSKGHSYPHHCCIWHWWCNVSCHLWYHSQHYVLIRYTINTITSICVCLTLSLFKRQSSLFGNLTAHLESDSKCVFMYLVWFSE